MNCLRYWAPLMIDFKNIDYLLNGSDEQRRIYALLKETEALEKLSIFFPVLIGTYPLDIQTDTSDIDIACQFVDAGIFESELFKLFGHYENFGSNRSMTYNELAVVANFNVNGQEFEIFGQAIPVDMQMGYLHMIAEYRILSEYDEHFKQTIIDLKRKGIKTEPAFAKLLNLEDDPYQALLKFVE